jgi:hypothetical protein
MLRTKRASLGMKRNFTGTTTCPWSVMKMPKAEAILARRTFWLTFLIVPSSTFIDSMRAMLDGLMKKRVNLAELEAIAAKECSFRKERTRITGFALKEAHKE